MLYSITPIYVPGGMKILGHSSAPIVAMGNVAWEKPYATAQRIVTSRLVSLRVTGQKGKERKGKEKLMVGEKREVMASEEWRNVVT
jgi:hypothetical protein